MDMGMSAHRTDQSNSHGFCDVANTQLTVILSFGEAI
jgi:hypothetical protein